MIPFFILHALGIEVELNQLPLITAMTTFSVAMTCFIPTPGATGGIEFAFTTIFTASLFGNLSNDIGVTGMILWRALTYYLLMIISALAYIIFEIRVKKYKKKQQTIEEV